MQKILGCALYAGARYRLENTVFYNTKCGETTNKTEAAKIFLDKTNMQHYD
jgi:hypothetical protein